MGKIIVTQLQENAIELYKEEGKTIEQFIWFAHVWTSQFSPLKDLTVDDMARILYEPDSYEVECHLTKEESLWAAHYESNQL